jgi:hypothetical protein
MVESIENINPPGWTFEDDRLDATKMSETVPKSTAQTRVKEFWQWKGKMQMQSAGWDVPLSIGRRLREKFNSTSFASEEKHANPWLLSMFDLGHAGLCEYLIQSKYEVRKTPERRRKPQPDIRTYSTHSWTTTSNQAGLLSQERPPVEPKAVPSFDEATQPAPSENVISIAVATRRFNTSPACGHYFVDTTTIQPSASLAEVALIARY